MQMRFKRQSWLIIGLIIIAGVVATAGYFIWPKQVTVEAPILVTMPVKEICEARRLLDGVCVASGSEAPPLVALMVENHVESRPQAGLAEANLVIEAPVEGGVSRMLAVYTLSESIARIGPVRSARPYYLDWVKELDALYGHVGGSEEALQKIYSLRITDLDQYYHDKYYWREHLRKAPHNVYTSTAFLIQALVDRQIQTGEFDPWLFKEEAALSERPASYQVITLRYSDKFLQEYKVHWLYDQGSNGYVRKQADGSFNDEQGDEVQAKNLVVQLTDVAIMDDVGRRQVKTVGVGRALIFQDGREIKGTWKKLSREGRTRFYDDHGKEIEFNAGLTWVNVLPDNEFAFLQSSD